MESGLAEVSRVFYVKEKLARIMGNSGTVVSEAPIGNGVLPEKVPFVQQKLKFPASYRSGRFITNMQTILTV
jgi:hypothetical protein